MRKLSKPLSAIAVAFLISSLFVGSAFAASGHSGNDKPGFGYGDHHHHHKGPPGHSNRPSDRFGDGDGDNDDKGGRENFAFFFSNLINFFRHHGFPNT